MSDRRQRLQQVFEEIYQTRMQGLPMVNPALSVAAIGFDETEYGCLGILVTPWCMNLILLPQEDVAPDAWQGLVPGSKQHRTLPSGRYEFVVAEAAGIGLYQSCSLFSPMFEFNEQAVAEATAKVALKALLDEAFVDQGNEGTPLNREPASEQSEGISRRDFLRGRLSR